jgi:hypothetical protein
VLQTSCILTMGGIYRSQKVLGGSPRTTLIAVSAMLACIALVGAIVFFLAMHLPSGARDVSRQRAVGVALSRFRRSTSAGSHPRNVTVLVTQYYASRYALVGSRGQSLFGPCRPADCSKGVWLVEVAGAFPDCDQLVSDMLVDAQTGGIVLVSDQCIR